MINKIIATINEGRSFLITSHVKLDGDALGSELAIYCMLKNIRKKALIYNEDDTPGHYAFLPAAGKIVHTLDNISQFDVAFVLDCSELERVGDKAQEIGKIALGAPIEKKQVEFDFGEETLDRLSQDELIERIKSMSKGIPGLADIFGSQEGV